MAERAPVESFNNTRFHGARPLASGQGQLGSPGVQASVTTAFGAGANANVLIRSRLPGADDNGVAVELGPPENSGSVARSFPGRAYTEATPAFLVIDPTGTNNKIIAIARDPGAVGEDISIEVIGETIDADLEVTVQDDKITIQLEVSSLTIQSTAQNVIDAINQDPDANNLVEAFGAENTLSGTFDALAETNLAGSTEIPDQVDIWHATSATGTLSMTGDALRQVVSSSPRLTGSNVGTGAGTIDATASLVLAGGVGATGAHAKRQESREFDDELIGPEGDGQNRNVNTFLQRETQRRGNTTRPEEVVAQDRAITESGDLNIQQVQGPRSPFL